MNKKKNAVYCVNGILLGLGWVDGCVPKVVTNPGL